MMSLDGGCGGEVDDDCGVMARVVIEKRKTAIEDLSPK